MLKPRCKSTKQEAHRPTTETSPSTEQQWIHFQPKEVRTPYHGARARNIDRLTAPQELTNLHTAFHTSQHDAVISFDASSLSSTNQLSARLLQLRSKLALSQYDEVISDLEGEDDEIDLAAVKAFAVYLRDHSDASIAEMERLGAEKGGNGTVLLLVGTCLAREGRETEALGVLGRHEGSLDA